VSWRFKDFLEQVKSLDEQAFLARFPFPILMSEGQISNGASGKITAGETTKRLGTVEELAASTSSDVDEAWVVPVRRKETSKLKIVTVGRGEECDIRISHPLVSKKHAYFSQDAEGWLIADAQSTNCTFADGNRLEPLTPQRLQDSIALRFGPAVKYRFFGPQAFLAYCSMRLRMKDPDPSKTSKIVKRP
jgi:FHA domain